MINNKLKICAIILLFFFGLGACSEDFLEPEFSEEKEFETSITTVLELQSVLNGAYDRMNASTYYGRDYVIFGEVRSDNAFSNGRTGRFVGPGQFFLTPNNAYVSDTWTQIYRVIANTNVVINAELETDEQEVLQHVKGQAYALRALAYMDLLRLYGQQYAGGTLGVPLVTTFRGEETNPKRETVEATWTQIGSDLAAAEENMSEDLNSNNPVNITTWAVKALQSRYYLYVNQPAAAAEAAKEVIDSGEFRLEDEWEQEANGSSGIIFALSFTDNDNLSSNSLQYILNRVGNIGYGDIEVTDALYNSYAEGDERLAWYTGTPGGVIRMTGKYTTYGEDVKIIRFAEVLLNYAEALVKMGAEGGSEEALEIINSIAAARGVVSSYNEGTLENVLEERQRELAFEGHRFFDLLRNGFAIPLVDEGQTFDADIPVGSAELAFPIPQTEINANPNIEQNQGY